MRNLRSWRRHRRGGAALLENSAWTGFISKSSGYSLFQADTIPDTARVLATCERILGEWNELKTAEQTKKPFFVNILTAEDLVRYPQLLDFALSSPIVEIVADYLGMVPQFRAMGLQVSSPNDSTISSQMFHFDTDDFKQVKCFINVLEVEQRAGPLTILPADKSRALRGRFGLRWSPKRFDDKEVFKHFSEDDLVRVIGPQGAGVMVDTANCLHYGSRARSNWRVVLMLQYTTFPNLVFPREKMYKQGMPLLNFPTRESKEGLVIAALS